MIVETVDPGALPPPRSADVNACPIPIPLLDNIDHVQGVLMRWRKQSACTRDLQLVAEKLGPVLTHIGNMLNGGPNGD